MRGALGRSVFDIYTMQLTLHMTSHSFSFPGISLLLNLFNLLRGASSAATNNNTIAQHGHGWSPRAGAGQPSHLGRLLVLGVLAVLPEGTCTYEALAQRRMPFLFLTV